MKTLRDVAALLVVTLFGWASVVAPPAARAAGDAVTATAACGVVVFQNTLDVEVRVIYPASKAKDATAFVGARKSYPVNTSLTDFQYRVKKAEVDELLQTSAVLHPQEGCLRLATRAPKITGSLRVGATLTATSPGWTNGASFTYTWKRSGKPIRGASADPTYLLTDQDKGKKITVEATGSLTGYYPASKTSKATVTVKAGVLIAPKPTWTGTPAVGQTLTALAPWGPGTVTLKYQWFRGTTKLKKATEPTYVLVAKDAKAKVRVKVTGRKTGYTTVSRYSGWTPKVTVG
jgi:hypothetical protein